MLCQNCKQNIANVKIVQNINGQITEKYLCGACSALYSNAGSFFDVNVGNILNNMFEISEPAGIQTMSCPTCGMTVSEFAKLVKFGCSDCYKTFSEEILPVCKKIHNSASHVGKIPDISEGLKQKKELDALRSDLTNAIAVENYELAAVLRDQIRDL